MSENRISVRALRQAQCKHFFSSASFQALLLKNMTKPWFVYMLLCDQKMFYVGITDDIVERFAEHKSKQSLFTKKFSDLKFMFAERYKNKYQAAKREKQLKGWSHAKKQMLINGKVGINVCTEFVEVLLRG